MAAFLRAHPKYPALMAALKELPAHLVTDTERKLAANSGAMVTPQMVRQLRSQCWLALSDWPSGRYIGTIAGRLNGRVNFFFFWELGSG